MVRSGCRLSLLTVGGGGTERNGTPLLGSRASNPVDYLERALEVCRAGRTSVSVGRPRVRGMTPNGAGERVESA